MTPTFPEIAPQGPETPDADARDAGDVGDAGDARDARNTGDADDAGDAGDAKDARDAGDASSVLRPSTVQFRHSPTIFMRVTFLLSFPENEASTFFWGPKTLRAQILKNSRSLEIFNLA